MNTNTHILQINHNGDNLNIDQSLLYNSMISEGYVYPISELPMESDHLKKLKDALHKYNVEVFDYSSNNNFFQTWKCNEFTMDVNAESTNMYVTTYCKTINISADIYKILRGFEPAVGDVEVHMSSYYMDNGNLDNTFKSTSYEDYEHVTPNYYPYIDTEAMFEQLYTNKENILILCGKPGTGKTSLVTMLLKYTIEHPELIPYIKDNVMDGQADRINVAYVKSTEVLASDNFWRSISSRDFDLVILDDLDYFLTSRDQETLSGEDIDRNKFLSQFLSYTDGIEKNKTNFIITTNQPFKDIDSALLRKGRLFDILELIDLTNEEAKDIWINSGLDESTFSFKGNVLQADLGSEITKAKNLDIVQKPYLKIPSISKLYSKQKKIGF